MTRDAGILHQSDHILDYLQQSKYLVMLLTNGLFGHQSEGREREAM